MTRHRLVGNTLTREEGGIIARCECGWASGGHFSSGGASVAFMDHKEREEREQAEALGELYYEPDNAKPWR